MSRDPVENVDALVESEGAELGTRLELGRRFNVTFAAFWLELDSELVYVGDAGATEPNGATERHGIEVAAFWQANEWLALNAAYAMTDAEYRSAPSNANEIPGAVESTATLGATAFFDNGFSTSVRARHLGEASLIEDDSVRTEDSLLVNAGVGYQLGRLSLALEVFNLFDSDDADIAYFFPSRLGGEPADGVEDIHFHPLEPRSVRATLGWSW